MLGQYDFHTVSRQHFQRAGLGQFQIRARVHTEKERAINAVLFTVLGNSQRNGKHMPFVEAMSK